MEEVQVLGAKDFLISGDLNFELKPETDGAGLELQGLDSLEGNRNCGPQCTGGGECLGCVRRNFDGYNCCVTSIAWWRVPG